MATPSAFITAHVNVKQLLLLYPQKCHQSHCSVEGDDVMHTEPRFCGSKGNGSCLSSWENRSDQM